MRSFVLCTALALVGPLASLAAASSFEKRQDYGAYGNYGAYTKPSPTVTVTVTDTLPPVTTTDFVPVTTTTIIVG